LAAQAALTPPLVRAAQVVTAKLVVVAAVVARVQRAALAAWAILRLGAVLAGLPRGLPAIRALTAPQARAAAAAAAGHMVLSVPRFRVPHRRVAMAAEVEAVTTVVAAARAATARS
jgi:hypothetical protein